MTSSILAGEKRWASARRGGMTVLGKVAVPKPINLPSQRLENHGLDPNVEIVPKGTLSWGSRSSSSTPNAWGSTSVSPNADGGTTSPGHVSGRPSSASGSRPSTAGSDRNLEPIANAWSQNSRPSSASGVLTSNQTAPASLRPRSADTRPASSQLSRFAESPSDNAVAWGPNRASEKLGLISSRKDGFALDSGDFPTLGTEKDSSKKANPQEDNFSERPSSSSGEAAALEKEKTATPSVGDISVNEKSESSNTWRRESPQHVDDVAQHAFEKWPADSLPYLNTAIPPQHFDAWHGAPINPPADAWFRGPPGGLPYATPLGPGGFPMEPFPFYRPQIPPGVLSNSQPIPPPGTGPRGNYPKNGDLYRPHISEAFMRPGLAIRPGFFPGPMPYDGFYGPPMGFLNPNERDVPLMGILARPSFSNRHHGENVPDHGENHTRAGAHSTMGKPRLPERVESGKHEDSSVPPYRVILKQKDVSDEKRREDKLEHPIPLSLPNKGMGDKSRSSSRKYEWGLEAEAVDEDIFSEGPNCIGYSKDHDKRGSNTSNSVKVDLHENRGKTKAVAGGLGDKFGNAVSQAPQVVAKAQKDPVLIQKIESLNAKARTADSRPDAVPVHSREGQKNKSQVVDPKAKVFMHESGAAATQCFDATHDSGSYTRASTDVGSSTANKILQPVAPGGVAISRGGGHSVQVKHDHRGKRFNTHVADGLQKKHVAPGYISAVPAAKSNPRVQVHGGFPSEEGYGVSLLGKHEGESLTQIFDAGDCQEQRAKMREIAKQRAIQLQKEEEERTREQRAKALAKLEELNKRTQATQKLERAAPSGPDLAVQLEREDPKVPPEEVVASKSETSSVLVSEPSAQIRDAVAVRDSTTDLLKDNLVHSSDGASAETLVPRVQPLPLKQNPDATLAAGQKEPVSQVGDSSGPRNKRTNKQKQNNPSAKTLPEKSTPRGPTEKSDDRVDVVVNVPSTEVVTEASSGCESSLPINSNITAESTQQKKRSSRSTKNKHKSDSSASSVAAPPSAPPVETNNGEVPCKTTRKPESEAELDPASVTSRTGTKHAVQAPESSLPCEEANARANNQWKSQQSRKIPRNQQASRPAEKLHSNDALIWAPVRPLNKQPSEEASDKPAHGTVIASTKSDNVVPNNQKNKRAEMERYVPKPVAKELAQQGILQQSATSSVNQTPSGRVQPVASSVNRAPAGNPAGKVDSVEAVKSVEKAQHGNSSQGHIVESRNGDDKKKKQQKAHGSWRQRGSAEPATNQSLPDVSSTSVSGKNIHEILEVSSSEEQMKSSNDRKLSDSKDTPVKSDTETLVVKDQGATSRGKRQSLKGNRNHGHIDADSGDVDKSSQTMSPEVRERQTSQWQPKSQGYNQKGKRPGGGEKVYAEAGARKDMPTEDSSLHPNDLSEEKNVSSVPNMGNQESKRENKVAPFKGRPYSPSQHVSGSQHNQRVPSGYRKVENQNYRGGRDHDLRDEWSSGGHDNRHHGSSFNRERHGHNANYEYQPVAQHDSNKSNNFEGSFDGSSSHGRGSRYKERNQVHPRRGGGNSYGRQSGTVRVDAN